MVQQVPSQEIQWKKHKFPLIVVVENIHSPSNVGMIMRLCEAFGVEEVYFSGPYSNVESDKFRKAARSSEKYLSVYTHKDTISVLQGLRARNFKIVALEITNESQCLSGYEIVAGERIALLVGSERHGVSAVSLSMADVSVHVEQYGVTGSLNVGTALAIALYYFTNKFKKVNL